MSVQRNEAPHVHAGLRDRMESVRKPMRKCGVILSCCLIALALIGDASLFAEVGSVQATTKPAPTTMPAPPFVDLYSGPAPGALGSKDADIPAVQIFLAPPGTATGAAMFVWPGGGYAHLAKHESLPVGRWLQSIGITAFVLRYRLAPYHYPIEIDDGERAVRFVRANSEKYHIDPHRIGIIGFSAGAHLSTSVSTHFDAGNPAAIDPVERVSSRPDLQIDMYSVVTMGVNAHAGSRANLLGPDPDAALINFMSNEKQVTDQTPPAFVVHSIADKTVPVSNSDGYVAALKAHGVEVVYLRIDKLGHGFGLQKFWTDPCAKWLADRHF
jgi:acetyl esterase/lipase